MKLTHALAKPCHARFPGMPGHRDYMHHPIDLHHDLHHHYHHHHHNGHDFHREGTDGDTKKSEAANLLASSSSKESRHFSKQSRNSRNSELLSVAEDGEEDNEFKEWVDLASSGELDFYTCVALAVGRLGLKHRYTLKLLRSLVIIVFMQGLLPALVFMYFARNHQTPVKHGLEFRIIGLGLYWYAEYEMWESACDDCRVVLLRMCSKYNVPFSYTGALVLGEFTNAFTGINLTLTLFFIFCTSATPIDLILNALAINFLLSIDNDMIDDDCKQRTMELFEDLQADLEDNDMKPLTPETGADRIRNWSNTAILNFFMVCRFMLILVMGFIFGIAFFFKQEERICQATGSGSVWLPFCAAS